MIYHANIRGFKSKSNSLNSILDVVKPNLVTLNEHGLKNNQKLVIDNFKSFTKNRKNQNMGGVSISVSEEEAKYCTKSSEGPEGDEYLITHHNQFNPPINVFAIYGETEARTTKQEAEQKWQNKLEEIIKIENRKENLIIIGDLNKSVGNDELGSIETSANTSIGRY